MYDFMYEFCLRKKKINKISKTRGSIIKDEHKIVLETSMSADLRNIC